MSVFVSTLPLLCLLQCHDQTPKHSSTQLSTKCMPLDQSLYPLSSIDKVIRDVVYLFFVLMMFFLLQSHFFSLSVTFCSPHPGFGFTRCRHIYSLTVFLSIFSSHTSAAVRSHWIYFYLPPQLKCTHPHCMINNYMPLWQATVQSVGNPFTLVSLTSLIFDVIYLFSVCLAFSVSLLLSINFLHLNQRLSFFFFFFNVSPGKETLEWIRQEYQSELQNMSQKCK